MLKYVERSEQAWRAEFQTALLKTRMPRRVRMVVLCSRPNYELRAFQVEMYPALLQTVQHAFFGTPGGVTPGAYCFISDVSCAHTCTLFASCCRSMCAFCS